MNAILLILLGTVTLSVVAFLVLLLTKFSMEDADWWLKILSGVVAALTVLAGLLAIFTGHVVNTRQGEKMTTLETRLEEQKERTANAERKAAEIEQQNLKLRLDLDAANRKRVRLEDDLEPRRLWSVSSGIIKERLEKFAGTKFILHVIADDEEARDAASIVSGVLTTYGWKLIAAHEVPLTKLPSGAVIIDKGNFTAAKELHEYLQANRWKSVMHLTVRLPGFGRM